MAVKPHTDAARLLSRTGGGHYGAGGPAHRARVKDNKKRVRLESSFLVIVVYPPRPGNAGTDLLRQRFSLTVTAGLAGRSFHRRARLFYSRKKARLALERYAEQYGLSLDAAVKELVEKQKQKRKSKERPH